jgi:hypothetical protein
MPKYVERNHRQTQGTRAELRRTSSEKIQTSAAIMFRELPYSVEGSEDCKGRKEFSIQEI